MKTVLITGAAGYVGSLLVRKCRDAGFKVIALDSGLYGFDSINELMCDRFIIQRCSIETWVEIEKEFLPKIDAVIHLSGLSNDPLADFDKEANIRLNYSDTVRMVKWADEHGIKRFVFASSASVYGMSEDSLVFETSPAKAASNYAASKLQAEEYIVGTTFKNLQPIILRKGTICGVSPRMRFDLVINTMVMSAYKNKKIVLNGGGENWRPLLSLDFITQIYMKFLEMDDHEYMCAANSIIYNAVETNVRVSELGLRVHDILKHDAGHSCELVADYSKPKDIRSYRMCGQNLLNALKIKTAPQFDLVRMVMDISWWIKNHTPDFNDPKFYNIKYIESKVKWAKELGLDYKL